MVDSFAAMDECVFKQGLLTMEELVHLLDTSFEGKENMRQMLLNKAPKFGNDIEEVDKYSYWLVDLLNESVKQYRDARRWTVYAGYCNTGL